jgi:hypothetical protein
MSQKSLTKNVSIDTAVRSHKCRYNKGHLIAKGDKRLKVKEGRSEMHYCIECAKKFLQTDIEKLNSVLTQLA